MNPHTQRILFLVSLALPLLLVGTIFLFPVTAWKTWGILHEVLDNKELSDEAYRKALHLRIERDFKRKHGEEGVWVNMPDRHRFTAVERYSELTGKRSLGGVSMPGESTDIYLPKHMEDLFTPESLDAYKSSKLQQ